MEVEKDLPPKRELKLFVRLSEMQRYWYQNILSKNIGAQRRRRQQGAHAQHPDAAAQVLQPPYLFDGAEQPPFLNDERLIVNCGKFGLLDKLLPRLKVDGYRVLIFSQAVEAGGGAAGVGGWRRAAGGCSGRRWRVAGGGRRGGGWRVVGGGWRVAAHRVRAAPAGR